MEKDKREGERKIVFYVQAWTQLFCVSEDSVVLLVVEKELKMLFSCQMSFSLPLGQECRVFISQTWMPRSEEAVLTAVMKFIHRPLLRACWVLGLEIKE